MVSKENLEKIFWKIMRQMYKEAEPPLDLEAYKKELVDNDEKSPADWFMKHYLSEERQQEIIDENTKGLTKREKHEIEKAVWLGFAPSCVMRK